MGQRSRAHASESRSHDPVRPRKGVDAEALALWVRYLTTRAIPERNALVEQYCPIALAIARRDMTRRAIDWTALEREDVESYALQGLIHAVDHFRLEVAWTAYMNRRVRGALIDGLRSQGRDRQRGGRPERRRTITGVELDAQARPTATNSDPVAITESRELFALVERLKENEQIVIQLRYVEGLTLEQTAERLSRSKTWACNWEQRALAKLRKWAGPTEM